LLLAACLAAGAALPAAAQTVTPYPIPTAGSTPGGIAAGSDGALWFVTLDGANTGRAIRGETSVVVETQWRS
jgi:hypothetical protein